MEGTTTNWSSSWSSEWIGPSVRRPPRRHTPNCCCCGQSCPRCPGPPAPNLRLPKSVLGWSDGVAVRPLDLPAVVGSWLCPRGSLQGWWTFSKGRGEKYNSGTNANVRRFIQVQIATCLHCFSVRLLCFCVNYGRSAVHTEDNTSVVVFKQPCFSQFLTMHVLLGANDWISYILNLK